MLPYTCPLCLKRYSGPGSCELCEADLLPDPRSPRAPQRNMPLWTVLFASFLGIFLGLPTWTAVRTPPAGTAPARPTTSRCGLCDGAGWIALNHEDYILCLSCDGSPGGLCPSCRSKGWQHRIWYDRTPCPTCRGGR